MSNEDSTPRYTVSQFSDQAPADTVNDLSAMVDYLLEAHTDEGQHYGQTMILKILRDNLLTLGQRLTAA
ncbi:MAG: hypothetical protein IPL99_15525 [Candidatus Competibacteraceae bacterium]|jgi:hypothetical protein|nr:hypothetical protein [Candidatus Competibacteraceae bacterium]